MPCCKAETGYISMTGTDADHLAKLPIALIDILAAHQLKEGLLLALLQRSRTGAGCYVERRAWRKPRSPA